MSQQREARRRGRTAEAYFDYVVMQHKNWQVAEPKIETTWDRLINVGFGSRFKKGVEYEEFYVSAVYKRVQVKRVYLVKGRRTVRLKRGAEGGKYRSYDADYLAAVDVWDERVWLIPWGLVYKFTQKCIDLTEFQQYEIATQVDCSPSKTEEPK